MMKRKREKEHKEKREEGRGRKVGDIMEKGERIGN